MTWLEQSVGNMPWGFCLRFDQHNEQNRCRLNFLTPVFIIPPVCGIGINRFIQLVDCGFKPSRLVCRGNCCCSAKKRQTGMSFEVKSVLLAQSSGKPANRPAGGG